MVIGAFQSEGNYRAVEQRYRRMARVADAVGVFATFDELRVGEEDEPDSGICLYEAGSWGPENAETLIEHDGRRWRRL